MFANVYVTTISCEMLVLVSTMSIQNSLITPFCISMEGGSHVRKMSVEVMESPVTMTGAADGTVLAEQSMH